MSLIPGFIKKPIGCLLSLIIGFLLFVVVMGVVGVLVVDHFAIGIASHVLKQRSGFTMSAQQQDISALSGSVDLKGFEIDNPDRFPSKDFLNFDEIKVKAEPTSVLGKRILVDDITVNLNNFTMVRNKDGSLNLMALKDGLMGSEAAAAATTPNSSGTPKPAASPGGKIPPFTVKSFTLTIKTMTLIDYKSNGGKPQVVNVNYTKTFTNVDETNYTSVAVKIGTDLSGAGFSFLADALKNELLDPNTYLDAVKGVGGAIESGATSIINGVGNLFKKSN